jgi:hypothetical protein
LGDQSHLRLFFFGRHAYLKKQTISSFDISQAKRAIESKRLNIPTVFQALFIAHHNVLTMS